MDSTKIKYVRGREILDSRGNPTVEAEVVLTDGSVGVAAVPSGASTGKFEAMELRDGDMSRYNGKGVSKAVDNINSTLNKCLVGCDASDIYSVDKIMKTADGTANKSHLGANAILAVSIASARASAKSINIPLYRFLGGISGITMPVPMMNILNGGAHASNNIDTQEFMIMPVGASSFKEAVRWCAEIYRSLSGILADKKLSVSVGDEGGFAPELKSDEEAVEIILTAVTKAGYEPYKDIMIAIDAASSEWKCSEKGTVFYCQPKSGKIFTSDELISHWDSLIQKFPIISIEDGLDEEDWDGWQKMTAMIGGKVQLVGDDLFVTNTERLSRGVSMDVANSILIKLNQIGTLSETIDAVRMARKSGYTTVISHRSGETSDSVISDIAVALNTGQIKSGAPCRSERTEKYNRLLKIEEELGENSIYCGINCFPTVLS